MINVELKGGAVKEFENGTTPAEIAKSIGAGLYKSVCCAKVDGDLCDLRTPLEKDCKVELLTFDNVDGQKTFWHTASHVLAQAVKRLIRMQSVQSVLPLTMVFTMILMLKSLSHPKTLKKSRLR